MINQTIVYTQHTITVQVIGNGQSSLYKWRENWLSESIDCFNCKDNICLTM